MEKCYYCEKEFTESNPASQAVAYFYDGEPRTGMICKECSEEMDQSRMAADSGQ